MATLLLRLAAPLQSWGIDSKYETRDTGKEPSKSGVVGLLAAALGYRWDVDLKFLNSLNELFFGVRVDQEGELLRDYHIAWVKGEDHPNVTHRYYLSDAVFLVGLESPDRAYLEKLEYALRHPVFPLFLGRRSCPPSMPLVLGIRETDLMSALRDEPWQAADWKQTQIRKALQRKTMRRPVSLRLVTDSLPRETGGGIIRDLPVTFNPAHRKFGWRRAVVRQNVLIDISPMEVSTVRETEHDPMAELRGGD
ncbi:MAG: type I-E CRISPR-associated protein Cas5/CasD [Oscillibacter sp.]|nr:type I-E CRISPR-associated protein Cas5/CasD [Oscillibacter sp.]